MLRSITMTILIVLPFAVSAGEVRLLNEELISNKKETGATAVAFSPDGKVVACNSGIAKMLPKQNRKSLAFYVQSRIQLWDATTSELISQSKPVPTAVLKSIYFHRDGRSLISSGGMSGGREIRIWSVATGTRELKYDTPRITDEMGLAKNPLTTPDQLVTHLALTKNGKKLAAFSTYGFAKNTTILKTWSDDGETKRKVWHRPHELYVSNLCWSSDANAVATLVPFYEPPKKSDANQLSGVRGKGCLIIVRDASDFDHEIHRVHDPEIPRRSKGLVSIPGKPWIVYPGSKGTVVVLNVSDRREEFRLRFHQLDNAFVTDLTASPTGSLLAVSTNASTYIFDLKSRKQVAQQSVRGASDMAFSTDSKKLAIAARGLYVWEIGELQPGN